MFSKAKLGIVRNMAKKHKKITLDNFYRPKHFTLRSFNKFMSQGMDKYNYGHINKEGNKSFRFSSDHIYLTPYKSNIKLREKSTSTKFRNVSISDHLGARQSRKSFVFYTANVYSDICILCGDIDPIEGYGYDECLEALLYIKERFHPNIYYERSTNGIGIHFYIIIDFSSFSHCDIKYDLFHRYNCNNIISLYSNLLSCLVNSMFYCKFDSFFGSYSLYSFPFSSHKFINRGRLAKLPCPQNENDFNILVNTPILSYSDLGKNWNYMQELLIDYTPEQTEQSHCSGKSHNLLCRDFISISKNDDYLRDNSAFTRARHSIQKLARELGRVPNYEEWNEYYETNKYNTGEETKNREERFNIIAPYVENTFDIDKIGQIYKYGDYIDDLMRDITQEQINNIVKNNTSYRYRITYGDLDVGLGSHWMAVRTNSRSGYELCVPRDTITSLFKALKDRDVIKRSCDYGKCIAIREILVHIRYVKLIDSHYRHGYDGISQKWAMDVKFPRYTDYKLFCGDLENEAIKIRSERIRSYYATV